MPSTFTPLQAGPAGTNGHPVPGRKIAPLRRSKLSDHSKISNAMQEMNDRLHAAGDTYSPWTFPKEQLSEIAESLLESLKKEIAQKSPGNISAHKERMDKFSKDVQMYKEFNLLWPWCIFLNLMLPDIFDIKPDQEDVEREMNDFRMVQCGKVRQLAKNAILDLFHKLDDKYPNWRPSGMKHNTMEDVCEVWEDRVWEEASGDLEDYESLIKDKQEVFEKWLDLSAAAWKQFLAEEIRPHICPPPSDYSCSDDGNEDPDVVPGSSEFVGSDDGSDAISDILPTLSDCVPSDDSSDEEARPSKYELLLAAYKALEADKKAIEADCKALDADNKALKQYQKSQQMAAALRESDHEDQLTRLKLETVELGREVDDLKSDKSFLSGHVTALEKQNHALRARVEFLETSRQTSTESQSTPVNGAYSESSSSKPEVEVAEEQGPMQTSLLSGTQNVIEEASPEVQALPAVESIQELEQTTEVVDTPAPIREDLNSIEDFRRLRDDMSYDAFEQILRDEASAVDAIKKADKAMPVAQAILNIVFYSTLIVHHDILSAELEEETLAKCKSLLRNGRWKKKYEDVLVMATKLECRDNALHSWYKLDKKALEMEKMLRIHRRNTTFLDGRQREANTMEDSDDDDDHAKSLALQRYVESITQQCAHRRFYRAPPLLQEIERERQAYGKFIGDLLSQSPPITDSVSKAAIKAHFEGQWEDIRGVMEDACVDFAIPEPFTMDMDEELDNVSC
jgi:hypothetical protein